MKLEFYYNPEGYICLQDRDRLDIGIDHIILKKLDFSDAQINIIGYVLPLGNKNIIDVKVGLEKKIILNQTDPSFHPCVDISYQGIFLDDNQFKKYAHEKNSILPSFIIRRSVSDEDILSSWLRGIKFRFYYSKAEGIISEQEKDILSQEANRINCQYLIQQVLGLRQDGEEVRIYKPNRQRNDHFRINVHLKERPGSLIEFEDYLINRGIFYNFLLPVGESYSLVYGNIRSEFF